MSTELYSVSQTPAPVKPQVEPSPASVSRRSYLDLYGTYLRLFVKKLLQYRADMAVMMGAMIISEGAQLLFISVIFNNVHALNGWTFHDVLMMYGLRVVASGLNVALLDMPWRIPEVMRTGELDTVMLRPTSRLFQMIGQFCLAPHAFGRIIIGLVALGMALRGIQAQFQLWWLGYIPLAIISGALVDFSIMLILSCLSFWFTNVQSLMSPVGWFGQFAQFPVTIYAGPVQIVLTWIIPYAMTSFYPAAFLLRGAEYQLYGLLAPLMGFIFLGLAMSVWSLAIRHYRSTGS